jgi:hypothetical protein
MVTVELPTPIRDIVLGTLMAAMLVVMLSGSGKKGVRTVNVSTPAALVAPAAGHASSRWAPLPRRQCWVIREPHLPAGGGVSPISTDRAVRDGSLRIEHSQTRMTVQPSCSAVSVECRSRSLLRLIFSSQSEAFGPVKGVFLP